MTEIENGVATDFRGLFRGSANLGLLLGALSLDWTKVAPFVSDLSPELNLSQELSVGTKDGSVTLGTWGEGQDFVHRAARLMDKHGVGEEDLKRFLVRAAFMQYENIFFSMDIRTDAVNSFKYVFRRRQPLEAGTAMLVDAGVDADGLAAFRDSGRFVEKDTVHAFSCSLGTDGEGRQIPFFSQPKELACWSRAGKLAQKFGLDQGWRDFEENDALRHSLAFIGPVFSTAASAPGISLIHRDLSENVVASLNVGGAATERVETLLRICGRKSCSQVELVLLPSKPVEFKFICA